MRPLGSRPASLPSPSVNDQKGPCESLLQNPATPSLTSMCAFLPYLMFYMISAVNENSRPIRLFFQQYENEPKVCSLSRWKHTLRNFAPSSRPDYGSKAKQPKNPRSVFIHEPMSCRIDCLFVYSYSHLPRAGCISDESTHPLIIPLCLGFTSSSSSTRTHARKL